MISELSRQLDSWRALLPGPLRWLDNDRFNYPDRETVSQHLAEPLFSTDKGTLPIRYENSLDVLTAELRTRFYYARYMLYRPFVYKVLHFPELVSVDDVSCCVLAVQAACLWPVFMAPPKDKKRIVPHLFAWTNNAVGVLLILRMTKANEKLRGICEGRVNEEEIDKTVGLILSTINGCALVGDRSDTIDLERAPINLLRHAGK